VQAGLKDSEELTMGAGQLASFTSGGTSISVEVFRQAGAGERRPAVIMLHGADGLNSNTQYRSGARAVAMAGYQVFLVHYLDRTGERRASFGTLFRNFVTWMGTVRDSVEWVASRPDVDSNRIGLVGISLGAALSFAIAGGDRRIKAIVDYFGPLPEGALAGSAALPPTLILHGEADRIVPVANAYAVRDLLRRQGVPHELKVYPGQGHGFHGSAQEDSTRRVLAFLQRHLGGRQASGLDALSTSG
jgi:carboxymethylenebutenolidase